MNTTAPTDRAKDLEIQRLRAEVAELVRAIADLLAALDMDPDYDAGFATYDETWNGAEERARALLAKHGD